MVLLKDLGIDLNRKERKGKRSANVIVRGDGRDEDDLERDAASFEAEDGLSGRVLESRLVGDEVGANVVAQRVAEELECLVVDANETRPAELVLLVGRRVADGPMLCPRSCQVTSGAVLSSCW